MKDQRSRALASVDNIYRLDGRVPVGKAIPFGLQHVLAMFVANVTPVMLIASVAVYNGQAFTAIDTALLIQAAMLIAGIGTLIQLYPVWRIGSRLPVVMGLSFTFLSAMMTLAAKDYGLMIGAVIVGGCIEGLLGLTAKYWRRFVSPIVSACVVTTIGFSLLSTGISSFASSAVYPTGAWQNLLVAVITLAACLVYNSLAKGFWKQLYVLFGLIELHLHLDGAVPPETMWRMAQEKGLALPADTLEDFRAWLVRTADCRDVNTYLARFELPLQLMQDAPSIERITFDVLSTLARQGHVYDEVRFAPQLHTRQALCQQDAIEAVLAGRARALRAFPDYRCGILLCCMCIGPETVNMQENLQTVRLTRQYLGSGVVGLDLAGAEGIVPLENFHPIFDLARELSLPFTCHAGDSQGPETVRAALDFGAKRIGHGHHIYDDPSLWPRAIRQGVTLEICPTSNIQCKTQPSYALHPAKRLLDAGLRVTISTDNMTLAAVTLEDEYRHCVTQMGFTGEDLRTMARYALDAAFLPEAEKREIAGKF